MGELVFVGLGLFDERDITVKGVFRPHVYVAGGNVASRHGGSAPQLCDYGSDLSGAPILFRVSKILP